MTEGRAEIEILGQRLSIRGRGTPEYIRGLADYLNERVQDVREQARVYDPLRQSLLAGLHVADELFRAREADRALTDRLERLLADLDGALAGGPEPR
jgi:cell division protein ZapA (FtsZ GTPase activity inhibitor)